MVTNHIRKISDLSSDLIFIQAPVDVFFKGPVFIELLIAKRTGILEIDLRFLGILKRMMSVTSGIYANICVY